ncbi:MAG: hypothetical protein QOC64_3600 [Solirubrobacteraceae bacterium]|nr:hypothetical protein [Solirubrobacteraceae bacterium]
MSKPIIVGYDPHRRAHGPVDLGAAMAKVTGAPLIIACVQARSPVLPISAGEELPYAIADRELVEDCGPAMEEVDADMRAAGVPYECRGIAGTRAARALQALAEEEDAGLVVIGWTRPEAAERALGAATAASLLHGAPCPVAVAPLSWASARPFATVGCAWLDTDEGNEALRSAHALARRAGATLHVLTVLRLGKGAKVSDEDRRRAEEDLRRAISPLAGDVAVEVHLFAGDPAEILVGASSEIDVLVCGSRGYGPLRAVLLGSVSRRLVREAQCPVIVLPRGVEASLEALLAEAPGAATPA